jgi:hypothetical protein
VITSEHLKATGWAKVNRCKLPRPIFEELLRAARSGDRRMHLVVIGDELAPVMGHVHGYMPNVPSAIRALRGVVPMAKLRGSAPNAIAMIPDVRDRSEHSPLKIKVQFERDIRCDLKGKTTARVDYRIGTVDRWDFYNLVETPQQILTSLGIPTERNGIPVHYIATSSTEPYGDFAMLMAPGRSKLLASIPRCLPTELVGYMSQAGHQNSILIVPKHLFSAVPKDLIRSKEIIDAGQGSDPATILKAALKLWAPDPTGYAVSRGSAPAEPIATFGRVDSKLIRSLYKAYPNQVTEFERSDLNTFLKNNLLRCIVVVKNGDFGVILRNGVSGAAGGL